jgi:DNA-binding PadR family transcriptional regulator
MTVSMALLALLDATESSHGFALKRQYDDLLGGERELRSGQVYSTLARLERDGLAAGVGVSRAGAGERKLYAITDAGVSEFDAWLRTPHGAGGRPTELFTKVILALVSGRSAAEVMDGHREVYLTRMREVTRARSEGDVVARLTGDFELLHLEADVKWVELAGQRLEQLTTRFGTAGTAS